MNKLLAGILLAISVIASACVGKASSGNAASGRIVDSDDRSGFVVLSDVVPDVILEIRYYGTYNFVGRRIDGYNAPVALCTGEAAMAIAKASAILKEKGFRLKIYDAYRPQCAVDCFVRWAADRSDTAMKRIFYPDLNKSLIMPLDYLSSHSAHSRGSTFDVTLFDEKRGTDADMGGVFDFFGPVSHPDYEGLSTIQKENRRILRDAMRSAGFRSLYTEWWHFTLIGEPYPSTYFTFPVE